MEFPENRRDPKAVVTVLPSPAKPDGATWCVYAHCLDGKVFYIGCGNERRPLAKHTRGPKWIQFVDLVGRYEVQILAWYSNLTDAQQRELLEITTQKPFTNVTHVNPPKRPRKIGAPGERRGGRRVGAGRPKSIDRCHCGKHTMPRAISLRLRCQRPLPFYTT